jgi:hypothetical protein
MLFILLLVESDWLRDPQPDRFDLSGMTAC